MALTETYFKASLDKAVASFENISWKNVIAVIKELIKWAEKYFEGEGRGAEKREWVKATLKQLDEKYGLTKKLLDIIPLPFWARPIASWLLPKIVDILIDAIVEMLYSHEEEFPDEEV